MQYADDRRGASSEASDASSGEGWLAERLRDPRFRRDWFRAELRSQVLSQFKALRKARGLTQEELAAIAQLKQSAVGRFERSAKPNWNLESLLKLADALDAKLEIRIVPAENAVNHIQSRIPEECRGRPCAD